MHRALQDQVPAVGEAHPYSSADPMEALRAAQLDGAGYKIYEVDWKYTPDQ